MRGAAILALLLAPQAGGVTIEEVRAAITRIRKMPVLERVPELQRLQERARDLAEAGIAPETANPPDCAAAIAADDRFEGDPAGCLGPVNRRDLAKDWRALETTVHHPCGLNTALDIYQRKGASWIRRLSNDPASTRGEETARSPWFLHDVRWFRMKDGVEYVGFTRSRLWCTSTLHPVIFELHALRSDKFEPVVTLERMARITGADPPIRMKLHEGEATAEFQAIGPGSFDRVVVARYRIEGLRAERITPIALAPHNFVDEWREMSEAEAMRFVEGERGPRLSEWRRKSAMSFTRACRITSQLWRAESLNDVEPVQVIDRGGFDYWLQLIPSGERQPCADGWIFESPTLDKVSLIDPKLPKPKPPVLGR